MIETELSRVWWQPHTCGCKLSYYKSETKPIEPAVSPYVSGQGEAFERLPEWQQEAIRLLVQKDDSLVVVRSRFETAVRSLKGLLRRIVHCFDEQPLPAGSRMRAEVTEVCEEHRGFSEPLQTQLAQVDRVCRCKWLEIMIGEHHEGGKFGHRMLELCFAHAEIPYSSIPDLVYEAGRKLTPVFDPSLRAELRDGVAVMIYKDTAGKEHVLTMEQSAVEVRSE